MGKAELEASLTTLDVWLIIFGILVAVGVVGESIAGFLHWRRSDQLQVIQTSENLELLQEITRLRAREPVVNDALRANAEVSKAIADSTKVLGISANFLLTLSQ